MCKRNVLYLHSVLSHVLNALRNTITECVFLSRCFPLSLTRFHSFSCWSTLLFSLASSHSYHFPCLTSPICLFLFCPPLPSPPLSSRSLLSPPRALLLSPPPPPPRLPLFSPPLHSPLVSLSSLLSSPPLSSSLPLFSPPLPPPLVPLPSPLLSP